MDLYLKLGPEIRPPEGLVKRAVAALGITGPGQRIELAPSWDPPQSRALVAALAAEALRRGYEPVILAGHWRNPAVVAGDAATVQVWGDETPAERVPDWGTFPMPRLLLVLPDRSGGVAFWGDDNGEMLSAQSWGRGATTVADALFGIIWQASRPLRDTPA
jgi:hypothetical protein